MRAMLPIVRRKVKRLALWSQTWFVRSLFQNISSFDGPTLQGTKLAKNRPNELALTRGGRSFSRNSGDSTGAKYAWEFRHSRPGSILDDTEGVATLLKRMLPPGWTFPATHEMHQRGELLSVAHHLAQFLSAMNKSFIGYENKLAKVPDQAELDETSEDVQAMVEKLAEAQSSLARAEKEIEALKLDNSVLDRRVKEMELYKGVSDQQITRLMADINELTEKKLALEANHLVLKRRAIREGKEEMLSSIQFTLLAVKEKFKKQETKGKAGAAVQELESNILLLEDIIDQKITDLHKEHSTLANELPEATKAYENTVVSDFSISKLAFPQISESVGTPMEVYPSTGTPTGLDPFGTNFLNPKALPVGEKETSVTSKERQSAVGKDPGGEGSKGAYPEPSSVGDDAGKTLG